MLCNADSIFSCDTPRISTHRTVFVNTCTDDTQFCHLSVTLLIRLTENFGLLQFKVFRMRCQGIVEPVNILRCNIDIYLDGIVSCSVGIIVQHNTNIGIYFSITVYIGVSVKLGIVSPERGVELIPKLNKFSVSLVNRNAIPHVLVLIFIHF